MELGCASAFRAHSGSAAGDARRVRVRATSNPLHRHELESSFRSRRVDENFGLERVDVEVGHQLRLEIVVSHRSSRRMRDAAGDDPVPRSVYPSEHVAGGERLLDPMKAGRDLLAPPRARPGGRRCVRPCRDRPCMWGRGPPAASPPAKAMVGISTTASTDEPRQSEAERRASGCVFLCCMEHQLLPRSRERLLDVPTNSGRCRALANRSTLGESWKPQLFAA